MQKITIALFGIKMSSLSYQPKDTREAVRIFFQRISWGAILARWYCKTSL